MPKIRDDASAAALAMRTGVMSGLPPASDLTDLKIIEVRHPLTDTNSRETVFRVAVAANRVVARQYGTYTARRDTWGPWEAYFGVYQRGVNEVPLPSMSMTLRKVLHLAQPATLKDANAIAAVVREARQALNDWRTRDIAV